MDIKNEIDHLVRRISGAHKANQFPDYIESLRFPHYKSIAQDAKITFDFPLTILIGNNGSGKSSALQALYGCPEGVSTGTYWFTTPLDPIKQNRRKGEIPSVIYTYRLDGEVCEVIKRRSGVAKGLDYWETSRPILMYGMEPLEDGKRNPPIKKEVKFLDFRSELSAFDKFFHFGTFKTRKTIKSKQDYLRKYSDYVRQGLNNAVVINKYRRSNKIVERFNNQLVENLSDILGKSYSYCSILLHNFYGEEGSTVLFSYSHNHYSEAFAGRGEYAVAKLIYEISKADDGSLLILDEPEVSLHPSAQEKLKLFLLKACLRKKLQIVLSTHSPKIIEFLPDKAIKLFYDQGDGKFNIQNGASYFQAFNQIGEKISNDHMKKIIVEDSLAKILIEKILLKMGGDYSLLFEVVYFPGGAEYAIKSSSLYSQENETSKFLLLDGDKRKPHYDPDDFTAKKSEDLKFLKAKLKESTGVDFAAMTFKIDGNKDGGNETQQKDVIKKYLKYQLKNIDYLPLNTPEEFLWDEDTALGIISNMIHGDIEFEGNYKEKFRLFSQLLFGRDDAEHIEMAQLIFIKKFLENEDGYYQAIVNTLIKFQG